MNINVTVRRSQGYKNDFWWDSFKIELVEPLNITQLLKKIDLSGVTIQGVATSLIERGTCQGFGFCSSCAVKVNGVPTLACDYWLDGTEHEIKIEPLFEEFVLRDLLIDASKVNKTFELPTSKQVLDYSWNTDFKSYLMPKNNDKLNVAVLSCTSCQVCTSACPQVGLNYAGPKAMLESWKSQFSKGFSKDKAHSFAIAGCDHHGECEKSCPQQVPLFKVLSDFKREALKNFFVF